MNTDPRGTTPVLSPEEVRRLTLYKWKYSLESEGFTPEEIRQLMFVKYLAHRRRVLGQDS
jgi:hypothetical protein